MLRSLRCALRAPVEMTSLRSCERKQIPPLRCGMTTMEVGVEERLHRSSRVRCGFAMRAMAVEFPEVDGHPNRLPFEGCLTLLDVASDKAPSGARGHRVVLTKEAADAALPSLLGMAVDYKAGWDGHDARQKCGIITSAEVVGLKLSEAIAGDALLPQTALNAPGNMLANLQQLQVVSSTGTALQ